MREARRILNRNWPLESVRVVNLRLDAANMRLEVPNLSQDAIIIDLFENEGAFDVIESIAA